MLNERLASKVLMAAVILRDCRQIWHQQRRKGMIALTELLRGACKSSDNFRILLYQKIISKQAGFTCRHKISYG